MPVMSSSDISHTTNEKSYASYAQRYLKALSRRILILISTKSSVRPSVVTSAAPLPQLFPALSTSQRTPFTRFFPALTIICPLTILPTCLRRKPLKRVLFSLPRSMNSPSASTSSSCRRLPIGSKAPSSTILAISAAAQGLPTGRAAMIAAVRSFSGSLS